MIKKGSNSVLLLLTLLLLYGCSNDIELYSNGDGIPVVYCLLNPQNDDQYVRLGKTYNITREIYQNDPVADSVRWSTPAEIYIEKYNEMEDVEEIFHFEQVKFPKRDSGIFSGQSFTLYKSAFKVIEGNTYILYVYFPEFKKIVSAKTVCMFIPQVADPLDIPYRMITFDSLSNLFVRWKPAKNGGLYQGTFRFHYSEEAESNIELKYVDFNTPVYSEMDAEYLVEKKINPNKFFQTLANEIEISNSVVRRPLNMEYLFYAAGGDLALQNNTSHSGSAQFSSIFEFSNIIGGTGIFTSITKFRIANLKLSPVSIHNLQTHHLTKDLGFEFTQADQ